MYQQTARNRSQELALNLRCFCATAVRRRRWAHLPHFAYHAWLAVKPSNSALLFGGLFVVPVIMVTYG